jgi:cation:H+ antiporter
MLPMFFLFLYYVFTQMKNEQSETTEFVQKTTVKIWGLILIGLTGLIVGGQLVVMNSVSIANMLGLSEKIIALTIVAAGTSLPELVTSIVAAIKKNSDIAIGNVIGSNIFNILLVLSISGIIKPINYNTNFNTDLLILIGGTVFLLVSMITGKKRILDRWEAGILVGLYFFYTIYLVIKEL